VSADTTGTDAAIDAATAEAACEASFGVGPGVEPLSACQWGMRAVQAGPAPYAQAIGAGVSVGVIDSGVDTTHADVVPSTSPDRARSSSPTRPPPLRQRWRTETARTRSAVQDLQGHGTHVSTIIAGADNGIGVAGVAPEATIVALKACTIAGFCFADSVAAALRYAGDQRLDVVNLSLFADPWLYFCKSDAEQRAILKDIEDAARYAQQRGVVIVASAGNESDDLGHPTIDDISPDWPPDSAVEREVRNNCRVAPAEITGVITVSAVGPTTLASYSNVGSPVEVIAPGGDAAQTLGTTFERGPLRLVEHRPVRPVGGARRREPGRARRHEPVRVGQRHLDVVAARRGCGRAGPRTSPRLEPGGRRRRGAPRGHAVPVPGRLARGRPASVHRRHRQHVVLRRGDGQRAPRIVRLNARPAGGTRCRRPVHQVGRDSEREPP
jgi:hypothetical protein